MDEAETAELEKLGREAADSVAGPESVEQVKVTLGADFDYQPVYQFSFLIEQSRARQRPGLLRIRLEQRLRDELIARGSPYGPRIQILDRTDWDKAVRA